MNNTQATINIFDSFSIFLGSYEILAPITNDSPTEITKDMNPTERLSASISLSTLNFGVKNSNNIYANTSNVNPKNPHPIISRSELFFVIE